MCLIRSLTANSGGGGGIDEPSYGYYLYGNYYNTTFTISNIPSDAKFFLVVMTRLDAGGNSNRLWGDIVNQQAKSFDSGSTSEEITFADVTWSDYVSSVGSGSITFTKALADEIGGTRQAIDVYFWS